MILRGAGVGGPLVRQVPALPTSRLPLLFTVGNRKKPPGRAEVEVAAARAVDRAPAFQGGVPAPAPVPVPVPVPASASASTFTCLHSVPTPQIPYPYCRLVTSTVLPCHKCRTTVQLPSTRFHIAPVLPRHGLLTTRSNKGLGCAASLFILRVHVHVHLHIISSTHVARCTLHFALLCRVA